MPTTPKRNSLHVSGEHYEKLKEIIADVGFTSVKAGAEAVIDFYAAATAETRAEIRTARKDVTNFPENYLKHKAAQKS